MISRLATTSPSAAGAATKAAMKTVEEELSFPILMAERIKTAADEANSFRQECAELGRLACKLGDSLRSAARLATSNQTLYDRPLRRVAAECSKSLERALGLSRRCRHGGGLWQRVVRTIVGSADFRKATGLLEASVADMTWLISVYSTSMGTGEDIVLSLPPIASTDPIVSWVWSYIAMVVHGGSNPSERVDAAMSLANLARDNDRNKKIIMEEGGVPPLLALLKDATSLEAQLAAATALTKIARCQMGVSVILSEVAIPAIIQVLSDSLMRLQICVASLVSVMAAQDPDAQEEFARENAIRPLVTLLSFELPIDEPKTAAKKATSFHSVVQINRGFGTGEQSASARVGGGGSGGMVLSSWSLDSHRRKERDRESLEVKLELKVACAKALWMLSRGNLSNSRKITETKGLFCLAKTIEIEKGELQYNCLMTLMEICAAAETDADLRRAVFKMNSPAAKLVVNQLLRMVQEISTPTLQVAAIKSVGYLAHTFTAKETCVIAPLVAQLKHWNVEVAAEAAIALGKFAGPENFLHIEHSKAIIEFDGVPDLVKLVKSGHEKAQLNGLILVCYLALHVGDSEALEHAKARATLEMASRAPVGQNPLLRELIQKAMNHLELYHTDVHP